MRSAVLLVVALGSVLGACVAKTDYGDATDATKVDVVEDSGFAPPGSGTEVHISGTDVTFVSGDVTGVGLLDADTADQIVDALANVHFLALAASYQTCPSPASDGSTATITADLEPGTHTVSFYKGCSGGEIDLLQQLETKILALSGFTAWQVGMASQGGGGGSGTNDGGGLAF
jgi:hypothetical protein